MKFSHYILVVPALLMALEHSGIAQTDNNAGTNVSPSQRQQGRRNGRLNRRDRSRFARSPLMQALDADKDGNLSKAELENATVSLSALDQNGDGDLTYEEISPFIGRESRRAGNGRGERVRRFRGERDRRTERPRRPNRPGSDYADSRSRRRGPDGERRRSREGRRRPEGPEGRQREDRRRNRFERGGPESRQPRGLGRPNPEQMLRRFLSLDKNGDEKVSREEMPDRLQGMLERFDKDGDGALNEQELGEAIKRRLRGQQKSNAPPEDKKKSEETEQKPEDTSVTS